MKNESKKLWVPIVWLCIGVALLGVGYLPIGLVEEGAMLARGFGFMIVFIGLFELFIRGFLMEGVPMVKYDQEKETYPLKRKTPFHRRYP